MTRTRTSAPTSLGGQLQLRALLEGKNLDPPRPPVVHHSSAGMFAVRDGDWKLVLGNGSGGRESPRGKPFQKPYQLFNLADGPSEQRNVIDQQAGIARRLEADLAAIRDGEAAKAKN